MKKTINKLKKTPRWCYITLIILIFMAVNLHVTSVVTKAVVENKIENVSEMAIKNQKDFIDMQKYFQKRYKADGSVTYLLQPKDYIKLYKEAIHTNTNDSLFLSVPFKVNLRSEKIFQMDLKKNDFVKLSKGDDKYENSILLTSNEDFKTAYVFPIYHYRTHVSEFILFYKDDITIPKDKITEIVSELQSLSQYIK